MFDNKQLRRLILPLIIEQLLAISVGMSDTIMISPLGEAAISGVSLVDMINNLLINIFAAISTGGAVVAAQYIGKKRNDQACEAAGQLFIITLILSLIIMGSAIFGRRVWIRLFFGDIDADVMHYALTFFIISAFSYPFLALYNSSAALFRAMGNSTVSMLTSLGMNAMNICGNFILIYGLHLGVVGTAMSSLLARMAAAFVMLFLIRNPVHPIHVTSFRALRLQRIMIRKILNLGIPNGIENSIFQLGRVLVVSIIASFGTVQIAANAVANNFDGMGCIPAQAMNLAMITVIGQCVGAGDYKQAVFYTKKLLKITYIIGGILNFFILITLPIMLNVYSLTPETAKLALVLIFIHDGFAIFLWPASFTLPNALRAANDVKYTMLISIFSMCVFRLLLSYIIGKHMGMGAFGVWIAMVIDWIFRSGCFIYRFKSGKWKLHNI